MQSKCFLLRLAHILLFLLSLSCEMTSSLSLPTKVIYRNIQRPDLKLAAELCIATFDLDPAFAAELASRYETLVFQYFLYPHISFYSIIIPVLI